MAAQVNVHDAKTHFSALLERVRGGEEIVIAKAGTPVARLIPLTEAERTGRQPGSRAGRMRMSEDFDDPLPEDFLIRTAG